MPNTFLGTGNVGADPELKTVQVGGKDREVIDLSVYFDNFRPTGNGDFEKTSSVRLRVTAWDDLARDVARLVRSGTRVHVQGRLAENNYESDAGEKRYGVDVTATHIYLHMGRIESLTQRAAREAPPEPGAQRP